MSHSASSGDLYSLMQGKDCRFGNRRLNSSSLEPSLSQDLCAELSGPLRSLPAPPRLAKGKRAASSGRAAHDQSETEVVKEDPDFPVGQEFGRLTDSGTFAKSKDRMKEQSGPASLPSPKKRIASSGLMSSSLSSSALAASGIPATSSLSSFHRSRGHCHTQSLDQSEPRSSLSHSRSSSVNTINTTKTHFGLSPSTSLCSSLALTRPGPSNTQRRMSDAARKARSRSGSRSSVGYGFSKTLYPGPRDENFDPFPSHALVSRKEGSLVAETRALSAQNA
ncbi:hypothetical protein IE53DRAFT_384590 [Violaceomyces palustris]|uniref:Uncharacterized protein n=1 Tax=Violaceomyces palustris TaxID=1673888 RepID=A0ACD0P4M7_9BASI|nr:hypothetical protein IE53DRAFT_384590 [Violaceomyces palustris]